MPDELKRDLLLIASKLRPIARSLVQAAEQLHEKAPQIQAQIKPTAEKLGGQLESGAQQVRICSLAGQHCCRPPARVIVHLVAGG